MTAGNVKLSTTKPAPRVRSQGKHIDAYLMRVRQRLGDAVADQTLDTALDVVVKCVSTYEEVFGQGEVGDQASGVVKQPLGMPKCPCVEGTPEVDDLPNSTGLLYGKVQSGKTNASMGAVALALDNGFRCFVVLTSDNTLLGEQTYERFVEELLGGPTIYDWSAWESDPDAFGKQLKDDERIADTGAIFISTKNTFHLKKLCRVLWFAGARYFPGLLLDDEADNASLNTNASKEDAEPGAIFSRIGQIRKTLGNHIYLQVTATPQSLFLQAVDHPCKPKFCARLQPGSEYVGGDQFFSDDSRLRVEVAADEFETLRESEAGKLDAPEGLRLALATFLIGCAERHSEGTGLDRFAFLAHVDNRRMKHDELRSIIDSFVLLLSKTLRGKESPAKRRECEYILQRGWNELKKTRPDLKPLDMHKEYIAARAGNLRSVVINSETGDAKKITLRAGPNIFVGGNRLGRGLTIPNLIVTYYGRDAKTKMMDVVHQHARMFGYRRRLLDVTRLFSAPEILKAFQSIHEADEGMRRALGNDPTRMELQPVWVGPAMKPTRSNVLDPGQLGVMVPGRSYYPWTPVYKKEAVAKLTPEITAMLVSQGVPEKKHTPVPLAFIRELLKKMPAVPHEGHAWTDERILTVIDKLMAHGHGQTEGSVHWTKNYTNKKVGGHVKRSLKDEPTDFLYTKDIADADKTRLTLILRYQEGLKDPDRWDNAPFWAPTLILPTQVDPQPFAFMYNLVSRGG